jgi:hypothetical protein
LMAGISFVPLFFNRFRLKESPSQVSFFDFIKNSIVMGSVSTGPFETLRGSITLTFPDAPIKIAVLDGFRDVGRPDVFFAVQIRDGAGYL